MGINSNDNPILDEGFRSSVLEGVPYDGPLSSLEEAAMSVFAIEYFREQEKTRRSVGKLVKSNQVLCGECGTAMKKGRYGLYCKRKCS